MIEIENDDKYISDLICEYYGGDPRIVASLPLGELRRTQELVKVQGHDPKARVEPPMPPTSSTNQTHNI
ncbi:hypothetical protein A2803_05970 [Candidatus Woesebacteria bacterium RIFCSPHIGHO2_01_FULL_44_21]|uniref:Uncharacterized protein n=1 Tax=Candidatus Woesebacteria bacterium RIFCSPHIGHO2_01_FULL_44_21 TaxID=1802503 RepID=A0A1F7YZR3_9BACT|nr:MAG: hypothetical protein A2803_05970 [Candidatus Woesebacteria bacterium RIFCSPHIGHO2_01_FULL_44_21]OGM71072.1 MAG: hypothetical protein A2897_02455 [Candidatus Woesebacteria bacterium RIFCSPLOWO2_01_FULL_44_24b]